MPRNTSGSYFGTDRGRARALPARLAILGLTTLPAALAIAGLTFSGPAHAQVRKLVPTDPVVAAPTPGHAQVLTYHNDNQRTGANPYENILTPAAVKSGFGKLFSHVVDGAIYGQPLFVSDLTVRNIQAGQSATHKGVVFVTTANNSVYAFDADNSTGINSGPLWYLNFNFLAQNIGPVPGNAIVDLSGSPQTDIQPSIGIIGTPVIDPVKGTLYVLVRTQEYNDYVHRLHAIDITTGLERPNSPVNVYNSITGDAPSVPGNGDGADGTGNVIFDPLFENQRAALSLSPDGKTLYIGYGGTENIAPYHGWLLAYDTGTLSLTQSFNTTPNALYSYNLGDPPVGGGIDMSGGGLAMDAAGNIYLATGLGEFNANAAKGDNTSHGESILRLNPADLTVKDYFTPYNYAELNQGGTDLGAGGVVVLPDAMGVKGHPHLLAAAGNEGKFYLLDRDSLGKVGIGSDAGALYTRRNSLGQQNGTPAYFNGQLFYHAAGDVLRAFQLNSTYPYVTDLTPGNSTSPVYDFPGAIPSVSANGTANGIVWEVAPYYPPVVNPTGGGDQNQAPIAVLRAYDATAPGKPIWAATDGGGRDTGPNYIKFTVPTVANGKVFVGGDGMLTVYGPVTKPAPANGVHYVVSGPVFLGGLASAGQYPIIALPTLTPNVKYDFSVTAVGADGKPIILTQTLRVSVEAGGTTKLPLTTVKLNNASNATFTTYFPYFFSLFNLTVTDQAGHSGTSTVETGGQTLSGFDHFVLRAPRAVRNGKVSTILLTGATSNNTAANLVGGLAAIYDTLPAGTQPYDCDPNNSASWGLLPDDGDGFLTAGELPAATATTHFAYEFQWGGGDFDVLPAFTGDTTGGFAVPDGELTAGIPIRLYGVGQHVIVFHYMPPPFPPFPVSNALIEWLGTQTATAIINVVP